MGRVLTSVHVWVSRLVNVGPGGGLNLANNPRQFIDAANGYLETLGDIIPGKSLVGSISRSTSTPEQ